LSLEIPPASLSKFDVSLRDGLRALAERVGLRGFRKRQGREVVGNSIHFPDLIVDTGTRSVVEVGQEEFADRLPTLLISVEHRLRRAPTPKGWAA